MSAKVALQLNAVVGLASTLVAAAMISLVLTRPQAVASAVAQHEYGSLAIAAASQLLGWLHALLRFL